MVDDDQYPTLVRSLFITVKEIKILQDSSTWQSEVHEIGRHLLMRRDNEKIKIPRRELVRFLTHLRSAIAGRDV